MRPDEAYETILLMMYHLNVMLHLCGCLLLIFLYKHDNRTTQQLVLINLSFIELIKNLLIIFITLLHSSVDETIQLISKIFVVFVHTTILFVYYMTMYFLTLDRLLAACLNLKYAIHCTIARVKFLLMVTWLLGITLGICCSTLSYHNIIPFHYLPYAMYVYVTISAGFTILAVVTYGVLFCEYKNSIQIHTGNFIEGSGNTPRNIFTVFLRSNFYISIILIASFIVFRVIPDFMNLIYGFSYDIVHPGNGMFAFLVGFLYGSSDLIDALIYIFMKKNVRGLLITTLKRFYASICCHGIGQEETEEILYSTAFTTSV